MFPFLDIQQNMYLVDTNVVAIWYYIVFAVVAGRVTRVVATLWRGWRSHNGGFKYNAGKYGIILPFLNRRGGALDLVLVARSCSSMMQQSQKGGMLVPGPCATTSLFGLGGGLDGKERRNVKIGGQVNSLTHESPIFGQGRIGQVLQTIVQN